MARIFTGSSSHYMEHAAAVVSGPPCTLMVWAKRNSQNTPLIAVGNSGGTGRLQLNYQNVSSPRLMAQAFTVGNAGQAGLSVGTIDSNWHHCAGVFASTTSRIAYLDGVGGTEDTASVATGTLNVTNLATRYVSGSRGNYYTGDLAEAAIFNAALSAEAMSAIGRRLASPLDFKASGLVAYWPIWGHASPETERVGGFDMVVSGATRSDHPPITPYWARKSFYFFFGETGSPSPEESPSPDPGGSPGAPIISSIFRSLIFG